MTPIEMFSRRNKKQISQYSLLNLLIACKVIIFTHLLRFADFAHLQFINIHEERIMSLVYG